MLVSGNCKNDVSLDLEILQTYCLDISNIPGTENSKFLQKGNELKKLIRLNKFIRY